MTTNTNTPCYDKLASNARSLRSYAMDALTNPKLGISQLAENLEQVANTLQWRADDWAKASVLLQYAKWADAALENAALEALELYGDLTADADGVLMRDVADYLEIAAERFRTNIAQQALETIYRGTESSSNPMTLLMSIAKVDAAKKVMEYLGHLQSYHLTSTEAVQDIIAGKSARDAARDEAQAQIPRKMLVFKKEACDGGHYIAYTVNSAGAALKTYQLNETRKAEAMAAARSLAGRLHEEKVSPTCLFPEMENRA